MATGAGFVVSWTSRAVAAGYLVLRNHGAQADGLLGGTAEFAASVETQQMVSAEGVMRMRLVTDSVGIPPNGTVTFKPNGHHLISHGLKQQLEAGQTLKGTLKFERAGSAPVELKVGGFGPK